MPFIAVMLQRAVGNRPYDMYERAIGNRPYEEPFCNAKRRAEGVAPYPHYAEAGG